MKSILNKFLGLVVQVAKTDSKGVQGELVEFDTFGLTVVAEIDSQHEIKEKVAVYIPHKSVEMVSAREDDNIASKDLLSYQELFGGM